MKKPTLILALFMSVGCYAQIELIGKVVDSLGVPVEFANVVLTNAEGHIITGAITDSKGVFTLSTKKGDYTLSVSFIGYIDHTQPLQLASSTTLLNIILKNNPNLIDEVVITAQKPIIERKVDRMVFNVEKTFLSNSNQLVDILKYVPNVWINSSGGVLIKHKPAIIYVNGKHVNLKGKDLSNYLESISSEDVDKIEVKLNQSADLDGNMNSGVVNIITKSKKGANGIVKSFYTIYDEKPYDLYSALSLNYGTLKWNFYTSYSHQEKVGQGNFNSSFAYKKDKKNQSTEGIFNSLSKKQHFKFGFNLDFLKTHNLGVEYYENIDNTDFFGNNTILFDNIKSKNNTEDISLIKLQRFNLSYDCNLESIKSFLKFRGELLNHNFDSDILNNSIYESEYDSNSEKNISISSTKMFSSQLDFETLYNEKITSKIGAKFFNTKRKNKLDSKLLVNNIFESNEERNTQFNYDENIISAYGLIEYKAKRNFFNVGVRLENTSFSNFDILKNNTVKNSFSNVFPSFYYSRDLPKNQSIFLSISRSINRPSFRILNNRINKINDFRFDIGNPNLKPEFTMNYEIGLNLKKQSISAYFKDTRDLINGVWRIENDIAIHQNQNFGKIMQYGVVYNYNNAMNKWWHLRLSCELFNRIFKNAPLALNKFTSSFFFSTRFEINKTTFLNIDGNYMSSFISSNYENYENYAVNLSVGKSFLKNKLNFRLYVDDIFNTVRSKNKADFADSYFNFYQKRNTRGVTFWVGYNFDSKHKAKNKTTVTKNTMRNRI